MSMRAAGRIVRVVRVTSCPFDRFNLFCMKSKFLLSALCCLIALSTTASAQNLSELVTQLDSDQMDQRTEARSGIQQATHRLNRADGGCERSQGTGGGSFADFTI